MSRRIAALLLMFTVVAGAVAPGTALATIGPARQPSPAIPDSFVGVVWVQLVGRDDLLDAMEFVLLNQSGDDFSHLCEPQAFHRFACTPLPEGEYRVEIERPEGVTSRSSCFSPDPTAPLGPAIINAGNSVMSCSVEVWYTDRRGPVQTTMYFSLVGPTSLRSNAQLALLDQYGVDRFAEWCHPHPSNPWCTPTEPGPLQLAVGGLPAHAVTHYSCRADGPGLAAPDDIVVDGSIQTVWCTWLIAVPTLVVQVSDADVPGAISGVRITVIGPHGPASCTPLGNQGVECVDISPGEYRITTNVVALGLIDAGVHCYGHGNSSTVPSDPITIGGLTSNVYVRCDAMYRYPSISSGGGGGGGSSGPTTTVEQMGPPPSTTPAGGVTLPATGSTDLWPPLLAAVTLAIGAALSLIARRPVR